MSGWLGRAQIRLDIVEQLVEGEEADNSTRTAGRKVDDGSVRREALSAMYYESDWTTGRDRGQICQNRDWEVERREEGNTMDGTVKEVAS